ncbi:MAG: hypothetical protein R3C00_09530 [Hyphomonas sp.]
MTVSMRGRVMRRWTGTTHGTLDRLDDFTVADDVIGRLVIFFAGLVVSCGITWFQ